MAQKRVLHLSSIYFTNYGSIELPKHEFSIIKYFHTCSM